MSERPPAAPGEAPAATGPIEAGQAAWAKPAGTLVGRLVNNYELKTLIGEGGQGSVYLAQHPFIGRKTAVKVMRRSFAEDDVLVARFMNEALAANAIGHPNIIDIIDVGRLDDGLPYLMMEYLEGETLAARLRREGKLSLDAGLALLEQAAAAIGAAHDKGIVHRDLKPENFFLVKDGNGAERLKVLDFGIAKLRRDFAPNKIETDGALFGTPLYMSPEQCRGMAGEADARSDVYALGTIAFEIFCGRPPFVAQAYGDILVAHVTQPPPPPQSLRPDLPDLLAAAIERALAKPPSDRFASMADFWAALRWAAPWFAPVLPPRLADRTPGPAGVGVQRRSLATWLRQSRAARRTLPLSIAATALLTYLATRSWSPMPPPAPAPAPAQLPTPEAAKSQGAPSARTAAGAPTVEPAEASRSSDSTVNPPKRAVRPSSSRASKSDTDGSDTPARPTRSINKW